MTERAGRFRVYRVVDSVPHINLQAVDEPRLYTVYESGYTDLQDAVDDLRTGDLVEATLSGDPAADDEPWRIEAVERVDRVRTAFATDVAPPEVAQELWHEGLEEPVCATLTEDGEAVGVVCVQPRSPLPEGAFVPNVVTGLLPLESMFSSIPEVGEPAVETLFLDPDPPEASGYSVPYGVVLLFGEKAEELPDRFREAYDLPRGEDSRPEFDPYGV